MDTRVSESADWSKLPDHLWPLIGQKLKPRIERLRFRSVYPTWRHSIPPFQPSTPPTFPFRFSPAPPAFLSQSTVYLIRLHPDPNPNPSTSSSSSSKGWLLKLHEFEDQKLRLFHPITNHRIGFPTNVFPNNNLNFLDYSMVELNQSYALSLRTPSRSPSIRRIKKVIVPSDSNHSSIIVLYNEGNLGFAKNGDQQLTLIVDRVSENKYDDVIFYKGQPCVADYSGTVFRIDSALNVVEFSPPLVGFGQKKSLVECCGELYVVDRYIAQNTYGKETLHDKGPGFSWPKIEKGKPRTVGFKVYKLEAERGRWSEVENLGDQAFFLSVDASFSVSAREVAGCRENCIYFEDQDDNPLGVGSSSSVGDPCFFSLEDHSIKWVLPSPFCAQMFWPPPSGLFVNNTTHKFLSSGFR